MGPGVVCVGFLNSPCSHIHEEKSQLLILSPHGDRLSDQECLPLIVLIYDSYVQQSADISVVFLSLRSIL